MTGNQVAYSGGRNPVLTFEFKQCNGCVSMVTTGLTRTCTLAVYSTEKVTAVKTFVTNVCLSEIKGAPIRS